MDTTKSTRSLRQGLCQPAFLACALVLGVAVLGMSAIERSLGMVLTKTPLPPQQSLQTLDDHVFAPYEVVDRYTIDDPELQASLGTDEYLQWVLRHPQLSPSDPAYECLLFVTYYAKPDRVPHVPEECYLGSGYQRLATERSTFQLPSGAGERDIAGRTLVFTRAKDSAWRSGARVPVVYLFKVNGSYAAGRDEARVALNSNLFGKTSYFSKVELVFNRSRSSETLDSDQTQAAAQAVLATVLPVLEQDYWPAWPPDREDR
jgi:hypothetical protein